MQQGWNQRKKCNQRFDEQFDMNDERNDSIGNNSGGARSERNEDFDLLDDQYEHKMEQKQINQRNLKDEQIQEMLYGPSNKPDAQNYKQPEISVFDLQQNLASQSISILTYKKTLETIVQYVNAFSLDELRKFVRLVLDAPGFNVTFQQKDKKFKQRNGKNPKTNKMSMQEQQNLLAYSNDEVSSNISANSDDLQQKQQNKACILPSNGIQLILEILAFLSALIDKCTTLQNSYLQQIIQQVLQTKSRFYNLPIRPQQLMQEISEFAQNTVSQKKYQEVAENIENSYCSLFQFSTQVSEFKQIIYYLLAMRCVNNCFVKETRQNRLSIKMKIHCVKILNQLQTGSSIYFSKFHFDKHLQNYMIPKEQLTKLNKQQLQDYANVVFAQCRKSQQKLKLYNDQIIEQLISAQTSIDKKCLGFKLIDKIILNSKLYLRTIEGTLEFLQKNEIKRRFMNDHTHSQLLRKLPPIIKFLYEMGKISIDEIKQFVQSVLKSHQQFYKVFLTLVHYLSIEHLQQLFQYMTKQIITRHQQISQLTNLHFAGILAEIVSNVNLTTMNRKQSKKMQNINHSNNKKQQAFKQKPDHFETQMTNHDQQNDKHHLANGLDYKYSSSYYNDNNENQDIQVHHPLIYDIFHFLMNLLPEQNLQQFYMPIFSRHMSLHLPLLLPLIEQQLTNKLSMPKNYHPYIISILQFMLKLDIDTVYSDFSAEKKKLIQQKQETLKYQFINNLVVNCNLYDSIIYVFCKRRFDKVITEKCLNILILATKSYKPLEKNHIELLWKILGVHSTNQLQKQQFFQFIKQLVKNSISLTQQSVKYVYFEIILRLHYDWFTPKIYDCFEMLFMRLNEDGKLLTYQNTMNSMNNPNSNNISAAYTLNQTQLVGLEKFYYIYFWAQQKVSKKVKQFLFKLYNYKSSPEIKQKLSYEIIHTVINYLIRNPQSQDHILHSVKEKDIEQHMFRGFELFLKFLDCNNRQVSEQNANEQAMITVTINNGTREAVPPIRKSIEVNKNMLLSEFKELVRKQINPPVSNIELINKGKPLKVAGMSLKQLKIQNKNTILVQNMDLPPQRKQSEQIKLKQSKQTLSMIFSQQYQPQLLNFIAEKYLGEQIDKICEFVMDQDKIREIQLQFRQKKSQKIQEEKDIIIIPKKKYSHDMNEALTFADILAKEIIVLLKLIPVRVTQYNNTNNNKQTIQLLVDKQWQVVKKLPINLEIARKISTQIQREDFIDFQQIFQLNNYLNSHQLLKSKLNINNQTEDNQWLMNLQAYLWYILNRVISKKSDEFKLRIRNEKSLELFIVGELERLISERKYCCELYSQLIDAHETIIQGISDNNKNALDNVINNKNTAQMHQNNKNSQNSNNENQTFGWSIFELLSAQRQTNTKKRISKSNSPYSLQSQTIEFNPCNIVPKIMHILQRKQKTIEKMKSAIMSENQAQTVLFSNLGLVEESLLTMMADNDIDGLILEKLLSFLVYDMVQQFMKVGLSEVGKLLTHLSVLNIGKEQLLILLQKYGETLFWFYLWSQVLVIESQREDRQVKKQDMLVENQQKTIYVNQYIQEYLEVKGLIQLALKSQQQFKSRNLQWLFILLTGYLQLTELYYQRRQQKLTSNGQQSQGLSSFQKQKGYEQQQTKYTLQVFEQDLLQFMTLLKMNYKQVNKNTILSILSTVNQLVSALLIFTSSTTGKSINNVNHSPTLYAFKQTTITEIQRFIDFLFEQFIFQLPQVPILTHALIKQLYYQLLTTLTNISPSFLIKITDQIIKFDVIKRNHDHDNVDFKTNNFVGIQNLGCTCYVNSLIQQLYHTRLPFHLLTINNQGLYELNHTFMQLYMSTKNVINIRPMIQQVKFYGQQIIPNIQQDVEQFLISLLDYIESCDGKTMIDSIFGGSYSQQLTYFSEKQENKIYRKHKQEHFYNITLDIKGKKTLNQALTYFFRSQQLDDKIYCEQLNQKTSVVKRSFIKKFPEILIFTLKRFQFDMENMVRNKLNDYLEFPIELDLTDYSLQKIIEGQQKQKKMELQMQGERQNQNIACQQQVQRDNNLQHPTNKDIINENILSQQDKYIYRLSGILIHSGSAEAGHYYSYIQRENKWFEFNDRVVTEINLSEKIKGQCFGGSSGGDSKTRNAYMLFYEKIQMRTEKMDMQEDKKPQQKHHGIFLDKVPQENFYKILVKEENNHFIKQRLIFDLEYKKFVDLLTSKVKEIAEQENKGVKGNFAFNQKRPNSVLSLRLKKLQRINQVINPKQSLPIVHFTNQLMQIQQVGQNEYLQAKKAKHNKQTDIVQEILQQNEQNNQYQEFI